MKWGNTTGGTGSDNIRKKHRKNRALTMIKIKERAPNLIFDPFRVVVCLLYAYLLTFNPFRIGKRKLFDPFELCSIRL